MDQERLLELRFAMLFATSPFWRERWQAAGVTKAPTSLEGLPPTTPGDLAEDERLHPPYGRWRAPADFIRVGVPARPSPLEMVVFGARDLERESSAGAAALSRAGLSPGGRETNTLAGGLYTPGSLIVGDAAQSLGALDMPVGPLATDAARAQAIDFWQRVQPDFAVLDAAGAVDLARLLGERGERASALGLRSVALITDLRDAPPDAAELAPLDVPHTRIVGMAEAFSLMAASDAQGIFLVPPGEIVVEEQAGELLVTTLKHSAALVRYATGARGEVVRGPAGEVIGFTLDPGSPG